MLGNPYYFLPDESAFPFIKNFMKQAKYYKPEAKPRGIKRFWVLFWLGVPIASILLLTISPGWRFLSEVLKESSQLEAPYRYPFSQSLPGTANPKSSLQKEIAFYQERVHQDPESGLELASLATAYLKMARATEEGSWYLLAEQAAQRSLASLPFDNNSAVLVMARVAQARHEFSETMRLATAVLRSHPGNEDALAVLVTANLAMGRVKEANLAVEALVERIPTLESLTLLALVKVNQGRDREAIQSFNWALAAEEAGEKGSSAWTRVLLGQFYSQRGQLAMAGELYRETLRILPGYRPALVQLAELETRLGQYKAAESYYDQVIAYSKESSTVFDHVVLRGKARLKQLQGNSSEADALREEAEALLRQTATGHDSGSFGHRRELARLLLEGDHREDVAEALALMQAELSIRRDAETLDTLAWALSRSGRWREAQKVIQEVLHTGSRDAGMFYRAGTIEQALGNSPQAKAYFQLAQKTDPKFNEQARRALGLGF